MLSLTHDIVRHDIEAIGRLSHNHPVFLLAGHNNDKVAIKKESNTRLSASHLNKNFQVMAVVDPQARQVPMKINELQQLRVWVSAERIQTTDQTNRSKLDDFYNELNEHFGRLAWLKMEVKNLGNLADAVGTQVSQRDKAKTKEFGKALAAPGGLEKLGEIIAADLFNGNNDRVNFFVEADTGKLFNGGGCGDLYEGKRLNHLFNVGNIMMEFDKQGRNGKPIGLDSFDPNSSFKKWKTALSTQEQGGNIQWPGRVLGKNNRRELEELADKLVLDLEFLLGKRHRKIPFANKSRLGKNASRRLLTGFEAGTAKILKEVRGFYSQLGRVIPQGLTDRLALMGK